MAAQRADKAVSITVFFESKLCDYSFPERVIFSMYSILYNTLEFNYKDIHLHKYRLLKQFTGMSTSTDMYIKPE